jgi:hypothetical protein
MADTPTPPLDLSVPLAARPEVVRSLRGQFVIGENAGAPVLHPAFSAAEQAAGTLHATAQRLAEVERSAKAAKADPGLHARLSSAAARTLASARKAHESARTTLAEHRLKLADEIDARIGVPNARTSVTDALRASAVYSHLRSLPDSAARFEAVRVAIGAGDAEVAAAVLAASPLASGLDRNHHATLRTASESKFAPALLNLRSGLDSVGEVLDRSLASVVARFGPLAAEGSGAHARATRAVAALEGGAA